MKKLFLIMLIAINFNVSMSSDIRELNSTRGMEKFVREISALIPNDFTQASRRASETIRAIREAGEDLLNKNAKVALLDIIDRRLGAQIPRIRIEAQNKIQELVEGDYASKGYGEYLWAWIQVDPQTRSREDILRAVILQSYGPNTAFLQSIAPTIVKSGRGLYLPSDLTYEWK